MSFYTFFFQISKLTSSNWLLLLALGLGSWKQNYNYLESINELMKGGTSWFENPLVKRKIGSPSGMEPYDARLSRTVPLRRVWYHPLSGLVNSA